MSKAMWSTKTTCLKEMIEEQVVAMIPTSSKLGLNRLQACLFPKKACYTVSAQFYMPGCGEKLKNYTTTCHVQFDTRGRRDGWSYSWRLMVPPPPFKLGLASHPKTVCVFSHRKSAHTRHAYIFCVAIPPVSSVWAQHFFCRSSTMYLLPFIVLWFANKPVWGGAYKSSKIFSRMAPLKWVRYCRPECAVIRQSWIRT
jgi:hypothetical protein